MSRKTRKLTWPLPGMATLAIVAALAILVALPTGIVLAQQESAPPPPTGVTATRDATDPYTQINVTWAEPADRDPSGNVTGYRVDVSRNGDVWIPADPAHSGVNERYEHTGLNAGETWHYRVFAEYSGFG